MLDDLLNRYLDAPRQLRAAIDGMTPEQLDATPIAGAWSTRQVICHIADFEPVYADRMKRIVAEEEPPLRGGDPDLFAARLAYEARDLEEEIALVEAVRKHVARILRALPIEALDRVGVHSEDGPLSVLALLERITNHVPHHIRFVDEKRAALGLPPSM